MYSHVNTHTQCIQWTGVFVGRIELLLFVFNIPYHVYNSGMDVKMETIWDGGVFLTARKYDWHNAHSTSDEQHTISDDPLTITLNAI